ncbi:zinc finger protein 16-like isoform X2 [Ischnura elegans]|uniref:zinc finger protein 16-like isoform X2 n=1 Tax=Ischnura elegans TaxID=197161 RepID=UPI001ED88023|nr:zinc finger protein 16-like isoform X2 [Ischnura elegans]
MNYFIENMSATIENSSESSGRIHEGTLCRLCMKKNNYYYNIFTSTIARQITVADALYDLVDLNVAVGDGLPATLCPLCWGKLMGFSDFRDICHKSDAKLRKFLPRNCFRSIEQVKEADKNLGSSAEAKDCIRDAIAGSSQMACSVQPTEIFIPVPDFHLPTANMSVKEENKDPLREEDNEVMHGTLSDGIACDTIDPLGTNDLFHVKEENMDPLREENNEVLHGTAPDGIASVAVDPLANDDLFRVKEEYKEHLQSALCSTESYSTLHTPDPAKILSDVTDPLATDKLFHVKEENMDPLREENNEVLHGTAPDGIASVPVDPLANDDLLISDEDWEPIESFTMVQESSGEAFGLPAPVISHVGISSAPYLLAERNVRIDLGCDHLPPSASVTPLESKSGASRAEEGTNVIENDFEECGTSHPDKLTACLFPDDGQCYTKYIHTSKISGDGARMNFVEDRGGFDALNTTDTLSCIESREKIGSGTEAVMGEKEEVSNCFNINPENYRRAKSRSYHTFNIRGGFNSKSELSKHLETHHVARNSDVDAELSAGDDESMETIVSNEESDISCQPTTSRTIKELKIKRQGKRRKGNRRIEKNSGGMGERENVRKNRKTGTAHMELCAQNFSSKSYSPIENRRDQECGSSRETVYSCKVCAKTFTESRTLSEHMLTHSGENSYSCGICKKYFSGCDSLSEHMHIHSRDKPYACDVCNKCFSKKSRIVDHVRTHTGEKPYACDVCNKSFSQKGNLVMHSRSHSGEKPYECNICSKCFIQSSDVTRHMLTHTKEKPYSCSVCSKSFSHSSDVTRHMLTHAKEKPYSCNVCSKCFTQRHNLEEHARTHTGEKPYACSVCGKCFRKGGHLTDHIRTHTGERPYSCSRCCKSFTHRTTLKNHILTHTREKPYACRECGKSFSRKETLVTHLNVHK